MATAKVFISYRRIPSAMLATLLHTKLQAHDIDAYVDARRADGGGPFPNRLLHAIEDSDVFICLMADTTLDSDWVRREIEHAYSQAKPMIPVFQESYTSIATPSASSINALLQSDGIHVLDLKNLYVDQAIDDLARMIKLTLGIEIPSAYDTTQIGDRTFNLRPQQPKPRRWLWLIVAVLVILLGIFLFQWVNGPIISAGVAGTQTAIALAGGVTDTPTPSLTASDMPTATLTETPTVAPTATQTPPILIINHGGGIVRTAPNAVANTIYLTGDQQLFITGICPDGRYYRVNYDNQEGWVHTYWVREIEGDISSVPVVDDSSGC